MYLCLCLCLCLCLSLSLSLSLHSSDEDQKRPSDGSLDSKRGGGHTSCSLLLPLPLPLSFSFSFSSDKKKRILTRVRTKKIVKKTPANRGCHFFCGFDKLCYCHQVLRRKAKNSLAKIDQAGVGVGVGTRLGAGVVNVDNVVNGSKSKSRNLLIGHTFS